MKKRTYKTGSIWFDKTRNKYRATLVTPIGQRISSSFDTAQEADIWLSKQKVEVKEGTFIVPTEDTLGEWVIFFIKTYKRATLKITSFERLLETARHINKISSIQLKDPNNALIIQEFYNSSGLSVPTIRKVHLLLGASIKKAFELGKIKKNFMQFVVQPKQSTRKEIKILTQEEVKTIIDYILKKPEILRTDEIILIGLTSGMRLGEISALRICDINFKENTISVFNNLQYSKIRGLIISSPKTKKSIRKITVPEGVIKILGERIKKRDTKNKEDLVFVTSSNKPMAPRNTYRAWHILLDKLGIEVKSFHTIRHSHASHLLANGTPINNVSSRLGHSLISTTLDLYGHAIPNSDIATSSKVAELYNI